MGLYIIVTNAFDAFLTESAVLSGAAIELNPLMAELLYYDDGSFLLVKTTLVSLAVILLLQFKKRKLSKLALFTGCVVHTAILLIHISGMFN